MLLTTALDGDADGIKLDVDVDVDVDVWLVVFHHPCSVACSMPKVSQSFQRFLLSFGSSPFQPALFVIPKSIPRL